MYRRRQRMMYIQTSKSFPGFFTILTPYSHTQAFNLFKIKGDRA